MLGGYAMGFQLRSIFFVVWLFLATGLCSDYAVAMFISFII